MARIIVGQEHKKEFQSICSLFKHGFLSDKVSIKRVTDNEIVTAANVFEYCDSEHGVGGEADGAESELKFDRSGASWFAGLRGARFDSSSSDWEQLIDDVAADYHKYYSMIEFRQTADARLAAIGGSLSGVTKKVNDEFLRKVFGVNFAVPDNYSVDTENFYAVSMRLEINGGAQSEPLLGKIYFRRSHNGKYVPIRSAEAQGIDDYINGAVPSDEDANSGAAGEMVDGQLISDVLNRIDELFDTDTCADYILFNSDFRPIIEKMLKLLATSDEKELECTHVTVLGISHVEWQNFAYPVLMNGKRVMKLIVGLNNSISLYCTNCSKRGVLLVDNNTVLFDDSEYEGGYYLDFDERGFGFTDVDLDIIKKHALISRHLMSVRCADNMRNPDCSRVICASQAVEYAGADGKIERKCKGCPYPEVVYRNIFAEAGDGGRLTSSLSLDEQAYMLTDGKVRKCKCCGRTFAESAGRNGYCRLCADTEATDEGKKLYKKYKKMLPLGVRIGHFHSEKCCKEDSNTILFRLGEDRFIFSKLDAKDSGYIPSPTKIK